MVSNIRSNVEDGAPEASATAYALAQHYRQGRGTTPGSTHLLTGVLYSLDFVRDDHDELWKIKVRNIELMWREGHSTITSRD